MNRGDRRELIFIDDADRQRFVETLKRGQFLILAYKAAKATPLAWPAS